MATTRNATALWSGTGLQGKGVLNTDNAFFNNTPYSFSSRFENADGKQGTNPEELIAAAHAGCYAMALSFAITEAGFTPDALTVTASVVLDKVEGGFGITQITLNLEGKVAGMNQAQFVTLAEGAKVGCPVSKALSATPIHLNINFEA